MLFKHTFSNKVISEAKKFVGCKEDKSTPNRSACVDEIQKMGGWTPTAEPWCAMFVWAVVDRACKVLKIDNRLPRTKSTTEMKNKAPDSGLKVDKKPAVGSLFYYSRVGGGHTGIIMAVKGNTIYTVEGNVSDSVKLGERDITKDMQFIHIENMAGAKTVYPLYVKVGIPLALAGIVYSVWKLS